MDVRYFRNTANNLMGGAETARTIHQLFFLSFFRSFCFCFVRLSLDPAPKHSVISPRVEDT